MTFGGIVAAWFFIAGIETLVYYHDWGVYIVSGSAAPYQSMLFRYMMTSSTRNLFRDTILLWGESTSHRWFPSRRQVTRFDIFFYLRLHKLLSKQSKCQWLETLSYSLLRHCNDSLSIMMCTRTCYTLWIMSFSLRIQTIYLPVLLRVALLPDEQIHDCSNAKEVTLKNHGDLTGVKHTTNIIDCLHCFKDIF